MAKKKRQNDPHEDGDNYPSTDSDDGKQQGNNHFQPICPHIKKSVDVVKIRKCIKATGIELENCSECKKTIPQSPVDNNLDCDAQEFDRTLWLCFKCGVQLCGRSKNQHAMIHFMTPHSDEHNICINTTTFEVWCYKCDKEINADSCKKLLEGVEFVKKQASKQNQILNEMEEKVSVIISAISPHLENSAAANTNLAINNEPEVLVSGGPPIVLGPLTNAPQHNLVNGISRTNSCTTPTIGGGAVVTTGAATSAGKSSLATDMNQFAAVQSLPRVRGLTNLGNTCFFNAVLQCLAQTPFLVKILKEASNSGEEFQLPGGILKLKDDEEVLLPPIKGTLKTGGNLTRVLAETLVELQSGGGVFNPRELLTALRTKWRQFADGDQHDSHELLRHLLESVRSEDLRRYQAEILASMGHSTKVNPNSVGGEEHQKIKFYGFQAQERILRPDQVFRGFLVSTLQCQDCYNTSSRHEFFLDLSLPISTEKKPPVFRNARKTSPEPSYSKHQQKKEKEKEKKLRRANKAKRKSDGMDDLSQPSTATCGEEGAADVSATTDEQNLINLNPVEAESSSSSGEQSDADVEDNLIDDGPNGGKSYGPVVMPLPDTNCNNDGGAELPSPVDPEKKDDAPENPNKEDSTESAKMNRPNVMTNKIVEFGISSEGCKKVRDLVENLNINEDDEDDTSPRKLSKKRVRTISHSDWCTTMAPRYQCKDEECSIQSCLSAFTVAEYMTDNNKVGCDACTKRNNGKSGKTIYTHATKQFLLSSPPAILILHLKRFQLHGIRGSFRKTTKHVEFPFVLDLAAFCGSKVKRQHKIGIERHQNKLLYSLYGIVEHSGSMHGGHYIAYVKVRQQLGENDMRAKFLHKGTKSELDQVDEQLEILESTNDSDDSVSSCSSSSVASETEEPQGACGGSAALPPHPLEEPNVTPPPGKWYYVSDSHVSEASEDTVRNSQAYLLFYERLL